MRTALARCSVVLWLAAFLAAANLAVGCGGPRWPETTAQMHPRFQQHQLSPRTVDILPPDLQVWTQPRSGQTAEQLASRLDSVIRGIVSTMLAQRGYTVAAQFDWDGTFVGHDGMLYQGASADEMARTAYALSSYGQAVENANQGLLEPYLPHRLGATTGADATLYIGGWAYLGEDPGNTTGKKVAKGIGIALLVVVLVAVVVLMAKKGGGGKIAGSAGKVAAGAARGAAKVAVTASRTVAPVLRGAARVGWHFTRSMLHTMDAFGRMGTHIHVYGARPEYYQDTSTPKKGKSQMLLELTLVDNRSGHTLWHSRQLFPAHITKLTHVQKSFERMLATLPSR
ncbi:hypothetical protein [Haliangium sp.]|uniref:hypothetical protein n=1 Tax=Haliangium sp. TaxID=2663208 RepID=UPI003D0CBFAD